MAQDYITRDQYGQIYTPEVDPAFDEDYMFQKTLSEMDSQPKYDFTPGAGSTWLPEMVANTAYKADRWLNSPSKLSNEESEPVIMDAVGFILSNMNKPYHNEDGSVNMNRLYADEVLANIKGAAAEALGSMFGHQQMKALERGEKPTAADFAWDVLGNTPAFIATTPAEMYEDYLDEGGELNPDAVRNAKVGAGIMGALMAAPVLGKGMKRLITNRKNKRLSDAIEKIGKFGPEYMAK